MTNTIGPLFVTESLLVGIVKLQAYKSFYIRFLYVL